MSECTHTRHRIRAGEQQAVAEHLSECPSCAEFANAYQLLHDAEDSPITDTVDLDRTFEAIEKQLRSQSFLRRTLAEQPSTVRLVAILGSALAAAILIWLFVRRVDWDHYPLWRWLLEAGGMTFLTSIFVAGAIRALHLPPMASWKKATTALATLTVLALPLMLPEAHLTHPESLKGIGDDFMHRALACFLWGIAVSSAVGIPTYLVSRGARGVGGLPILFWLSIGLFAQVPCTSTAPLYIPCTSDSDIHRLFQDCC